jgi:RNA polymerase sigma-70 factor, ECF subfamily
VRSPGEDTLEFTQDCDRGRRDEHLVRMAREGDQDALEAVFTQYRDHLYYTALRLCGNPEDAEDALQDGLFSAFRHLRHFQARSQFSTWLTRIVINATLMRLRQRGNRTMISIDGEDSDGNEWDFVGALRDRAPDPEAAYAEREVFETFRRRLHTLPPAYQHVVWLRGLQGFSTEEVADVLGVSRGTVKSTLHRARAKLADLGSRGEDRSKMKSPLEACRRRQVGKPRKWGKNAVQRIAA